MAVIFRNILLRLAGVKGGGGSLQCPSGHDRGGRISLHESPSGTFYLHCPECGGPALDPVTFLAKHARVTRGEALERAIAEDAVSGEDREEHEFLGRVSLFMRKHAGKRVPMPEFESFDGSKITYYGDWSLWEREELVGSIPTAATSVRSRARRDRAVLVCVAYAMGAIPGRIYLFRPCGEEIMFVDLDGQPPKSYCYFNTGPGALRCDWSDSPVVFASGRTASRLRNWGSKIVDRGRAVLSVSEIAGRGHKFEAGATPIIVCADDEPALPGPIFTGPGRTPRVARMTATTMIEPKDMADPMETCKLPDLHRDTATLTDKVGAGALAAMMQMPSSTQPDRDAMLAATETATGDRFPEIRDRAAKVVCPITRRINGDLYTVSEDGYFRCGRAVYSSRVAPGDTEQATNFRISIDTAITVGECQIYACTLRCGGQVANFAIDSNNFHKASPLLEAARRCAIGAGFSEMPTLYLTGKIRGALPSIVTGTQGGTWNSGSVPSLGFSRGAFHGISCRITTSGLESRSVLPSSFESGFMGLPLPAAPADRTERLGPAIDVDAERFVSGVVAGDIPAPLAAACAWAVYKMLSAPASFIFGSRADFLAAAKILGIPVRDTEWVAEAASNRKVCRAVFRGLPTAIDGPPDKNFAFSISPPSPFEGGDGSYFLADTGAGDVPHGGFLYPLVRAACLSSQPAEIAPNLSGDMTFRNMMSQAMAGVLSSVSGSDLLDRILNFAAEEGLEYLNHVPGDRCYYLSSEILEDPRLFPDPVNRPTLVKVGTLIRTVFNVESPRVRRRGVRTEARLAWWKIPEMVLREKDSNIIQLTA